jgi:transcriptional regulator GlxA family with amidase domain
VEAGQVEARAWHQYRAGSWNLLYEIANRVGHDSDLAFSKAFNRLLGMTPAMYRRNAHKHKEHLT